MKNDLLSQYAQLKCDAIIALTWRHSGDLVGPIIEKPYIDEIAKLVMDEMETGQDHSKEISKLLIQSVRDFYGDGGSSNLAGKAL
jgi:hypothetical protein